MATQRQKAAAKRISENLGKGKTEPIGKTLHSVGYSKETSETPKNVTESRGFKELIDQYLPESLVSQVHGELLQSSELEDYVFPRSMEDEEIKVIVESVAGCKLVRISEGEQAKRAYYWKPDNRSRKDAIDMAYKLRGNYKPAQVEVRTFIGWTPKELEAYASDGTIPGRFVDES